MRISARIVITVIITMALIVGVSSYFNVRNERGRLTVELEHRAWLVAEGLKESVGSISEHGPSLRMDRIIRKMSAKKGHILGITVYSVTGEPIAVTEELKEKLPEKLDIVFKEFDGDSGSGAYQKIADKDMYLYAVPLFNDESIRSGTLVMFNDASYIERYLSDIWRRSFLRLLVNALVISIVTIFIIRWSITGPITKMAGWMKGVRKGNVDLGYKMPKEDLFAPISKEISSMAKSLTVARADAKEEAKLRQHGESIWTRDRLKEHVKAKLGNEKLVVVSNREPYMHIKDGRQMKVISPASGLITALEPIVKVSGGLWIAHGAGSGDKETVGKRDIIAVPPDNPKYNLKRVWLTQEEEEGYYYGFANEGLWPLCHIAHTRPIFRIDDWARYQEVNLKFAKSLGEEINKNSYIFIQNYHFALLPRIIKNKHPDTKVAIFWHIPWPNPEAFGICPWRREILHGMLGADVIGFHTQFHCNNFLETVARTLECRIDWESFAAIRMGRTTHVKPFPISVDIPLQHEEKHVTSKEELLRNLGIKASIMGVGVDRIDYTKGISERFRAVERFLEKNPEYLGLFTFVQIGAPSREHIKRYHDLLVEVSAEADRINWKFQSGGWKPIVFLKKHFSHEEIDPFYKNADLCIVSSLHDGMNLVAKEYVAAREDEKGVLILSTFAGASGELHDALLINPYDIEQMADMIKVAVEMEQGEVKQRMSRMRNVVKENNIYKWAADVISELTQIQPKA